jgi:hypothetical protein
VVHKGVTQPAPSGLPRVALESIRQNLNISTPRITPTPAAIEIGRSGNAGQFIKQKSMFVIAFVISFSVLVAGFIEFGKKKE